MSVITLIILKGRTVLRIQDYILIKKIQDGDKQALNELIRNYYDDVYFLCFYRCNDNDTAADLCQDTFLHLMNNIYQYHPTGKFRNYLFTIAINVCNDYHRKKNRHPIELVEDVDSVNVNQYELTLSLEEKETLYDYLNLLPEFQRETIILYFYQGLKLKDIAKIMNTTESTTKSRMYQGLRKLRKMYEENQSNAENDHR